MPSWLARPKAEMPYTMPKLIALARRRISRRHVLDRHPEHFRSGHGVNVEPFAEGLLQRLDAGDLGEEPQLDLRIVGRHELQARRGDEGAADLAAVLGADRNVLQIGIGRRQPPGRGRGECVVGVDAVRRRIDEAGQRVRVGRFQLRYLPPVEDHLRQHVALLGELFESARAGRPLAGPGLGAARTGRACRTERRRAASGCRD